MNYMKKMLWICSLLLVMGACHSSKNTVKLTGVKWVLEKMNGEKIQTKETDNEMFIQFNEADKQVNGKAACNRFFGGYEMDGRKLNFSQMGATRMTCPDINIESEFFKILENTDNYEIKDHQLFLRQKDKVLAVFKSL